MFNIRNSYFKLLYGFGMFTLQFFKFGLFERHTMFTGKVVESKKERKVWYTVTLLTRPVYFHKELYTTYDYL